ncbi:lipoprotein insertase outer membrane protein LolB [Cysteiniphilum sp. QT6929]|uniref:lipoprotein insertase outer membrane protein LolB n=1 Tax=Cysteiniphilum sp. QT6929 TaxID=2975055 RepID=UPI0024B33561|nr:lipoprotein insertase outer membrane protein LolB [Cysteiniphilum sp. QT6929]WHN66653.1 lipoprotein insertase outer membrane protein LolB [Cysteiniphilum sp. QT6929]
MFKKHIPPTIALYSLITFFLLLITGCTTISTPKTPLMPTTSPQTQWQSYQQNLQKLTQWQASGVIGIIINHKGESANFIWKQNKQDFWIQIYGPLGIGAMTFSGDNHQVELKRSNGEVIKSQSLEALMQSQLGWSLPIEGLYYWARGLYIPQVPYRKTLNNFGLMQDLKQQGWQIQYKDYMLYDTQYPLAEKIIFRYGDDLKITLVIKSWLLNP